MDVNTSDALNMDTWEHSDSFSVIVNEDDVLGSIPVPESSPHSGDTLTFSGTHDISMTKGNGNFEEDHITPSNQCFTLNEQPVAVSVSGLDIVHQQNEHLDDSDSVSGIDLMHQDNEHITTDIVTVSNTMPGMNIMHQQNEQLIITSESVSEINVCQHNEQLDTDTVSVMDVHQHEHLSVDSDVSGINITHQDNEQLIVDSGHMSGVDIELSQNDQLITASDSEQKINIEHNQNQQLIVDSDTASDVDMIHHENEQLISDSGNVSEMDIDHNQSGQLLSEADHMSGIDILQVHHESQQLVDEAESESDIVDIHQERQQTSESVPIVGVTNEESDELVSDTDQSVQMAEMNIPNESTGNEQIMIDTNHVTEMNVVSDDGVFNVSSPNMEESVHESLTSEQGTSLTDDTGKNIGDGIDILAEASLGLLSENIFNKESVNQIKDIVASTIANFGPSNSLSTEVINVTNEHGYIAMDSLSHTSASANTLFENTVEKFTSQTETVSPVNNADENAIECISPSTQLDHDVHDEDTTITQPISGKFVIPVTLAEVNRILGHEHGADTSLAANNQAKTRTAVENLETGGSFNRVEQSKALDEELKVVCGENIEIVESVEICMESSSAEVSFESPNTTLGPHVQETSKTYYENIKDSIEDQETQNENASFHAVELNLMAVSKTPATYEQTEMGTELSPVDTINVSTSVQVPSTQATSTIAEVGKTIFAIEANDNNQTQSLTRSVIEKPQQPVPMKVSISTSGTSKKVIVLLPSRAVGLGIDKAKDGSPRPLQKVRPGVKIPSRNLSSQIVSADELAKELYAQGLKKTPIRDLPQGGDLFYSRHLTKRLANRIVPSVASTSTVGGISQPIRQQAELPVQNVSIKPHPMMPGIISIKAKPEIENVAATKPQSEAKNVSVKSPVEVQTLSAHDSSSIPNTGSDDLLAILEGDVDEWSIDRPPPQLIEAVSSPITARSSPPRLDPPISSKSEMPGERKLDPALERELALQQLSSLDAQGRNKKDNPTKTRRKSKIQVKEDFDEVIVEEGGFIIGQPFVLIEDVKKKLAAASRKSEKAVKRPAPADSSYKTKNGSKTSKEGSGESNKMDGVPEKKRKIVHMGESAKALQKKTTKSPELVNGKFTAKNERKLNTSKEKDKKLSSEVAGKHKVEAKKEGDVEKKTKPPDNSHKNKPKKRKLSDGKSEDLEEFVGPMSRNMPPPPRTYSARIKRSPMFPDFIVDHLPSTSKNKAVSVVASANKGKSISDNSTQKKEQKPVTKSPRVSTLGKDVPSSKKNIPTKVEDTTPSKRGRESDPDKGTKKEKGRKCLSEIERLLMDEGAINMLYSVKQDEENRRSGGSSSGISSKKNILKSTRRSHKDLVMKTRLVKNAVLRLSNSPNSTRANLRAKRMSAPPLLKKPQGVERMDSQDSNDSNLSPPPLAPFGTSSPPAQVFTYPSKIHLPAEASRIIRRHSSSSNFSSRSTSPNPSRRLSVEAASPLSLVAENQAVDSRDSSFKQARKKGVPIFVKKEETTLTYKAKKKKFSQHSSAATEPISKLQESQESKDTHKHSPLVPKKPIPSSKAKLKAQLARPLQKVIKGKGLIPTAFKGKRTSSTDKSRSKDEDPNGNIPDLTSCLAEAATAFISDEEHPTTLNQSRLLDSKKTSPLSSNATSYSNLIKTLETDSQKRQDGEDSGKERSSVRQSVGSFHYKELSLRRYDAMVQVILTPSSTKVKNALSLQVLRELRDVLNQLRKDDTCRAVLVTSTGSSFCQGLDFQSLINDKPDRRKAAAQELAHAVTKFMTSLAHFNKLIIAGVHGDAVGLGVTMLPFFDMVFASDKATFYTPYARLGQIPEGAAVITLPLMLGNAVTSELLFGCRKLTASEALHYGLVTRILWPDRFQEELLPIIRSLANQSAQSMEATKALLRHSLRSELNSALEAESHLLVQHWTSSECQNNFKRYMDDEDVGPQRQRVDT